MYPKVEKDQVQSAYAAAKKRYADYAVDTDAILNKLATIPVSMNCWQGDDVAGFEGQEQLSGGGILATGNYPGRARTADELRADAEFAFRLIPGPRRFNLHASYLEAGGKKVERDQIEPEHFARWIEWAGKNRIGLDFNGTFFSHPKAADGLTLSHPDVAIRNFWIRHAKATRKIAAEMGKAAGSPCVNDLWVPDGLKDLTANRKMYRDILAKALDEVFAESIDPKFTVDAVESKLFGIGSEAYVVGSHEFYMGYAVSRKMMLCLDAGHFHPTEQLADKISAMLCFLDELLIHVSRPMRWDSDHVVLLDDATTAIAAEIARADAFARVHLAVDFFDASINRLIAWTVGMRATEKAILLSLLEPVRLLREAEQSNRFGERLALMEEFKTLPFTAVWDKYCLDQGVPVGSAWLDEVREYETKVLSKRR
ncbi:MAG TPA: L-rhamnose isomerase [Spirochaetia bacterium]|nr:L-rhamnose isomerase [Spirochaetia bacterium]